MSNENEPATKKDLAELKTEMATMATKKDLVELKTEMMSMEQRLLLEMGHVANVVLEQFGSKVAVIDDKYEGPVRQLRADLDAHCANSALHTRPAPLAPKRISRRKPQRSR